MHICIYNINILIMFRTFCLLGIRDLSCVLRSHFIHGSIAARSTASSSTYPHITTHYDIVSRETDSRWEGEVII